MKRKHTKPTAEERKQARQRMERAMQTVQAAPAALTRQAYIETIAELAIARLDDDDKARCKAKIGYGMGPRAVRGVTYYGVWQNGEPEPIPFVEICAGCEQNLVQVAGTTIHEIGHVLAGMGHGHDKNWKAAAGKLGLREAKAAGMRYMFAAFDPDVRFAVYELSQRVTDGKPLTAGGFGGLSGLTFTPKPCPAGIGSRGGKSRGKGSGSRMRKFVCQCEPPIIVRSARDELLAHCDCCGEPFERAD